jgi:hypothetical protein
MVREADTEMAREMRGDNKDILRTMETFPASFMGDTDRIRCIFKFQIKFRGFFFLFGAPLLLAQGASVLHRIIGAL